MIEPAQAILERNARSKSMLRPDLWLAARDLARIYRQNAPIPHIQIAQFLNRAVAHSSTDEFPNPGMPFWIHYKHYNENKIGLTKKEIFPPVLRRVADELNSPAFL